MELPVFGIHQELWHDAWVAATAAARSKKRQVDLDIRQRVEKLLEDYGPLTDRPLSLRVYGTMLKGFCVINNERARILHTDCERFVIMFTQYAATDDTKALKLPASKKPRLAALTLELDLDKVREPDAFDWTQRPLEEGDLLRLPEEPMCEPEPAGPCAELALLEQAARPDAVLPPADAPASSLEGLREEAMRLALPGPADAVARAEFQSEALLPFEPYGQPGEEGPPKKVRRMGQGRLLGPGRVLGWDNDTILSDQEYINWQNDPSTLRQRTQSLHELENHPQVVSRGEQLGLLRHVLDPNPEDLHAATVAGSDALGMLRMIPGGRSAAAALPEVQALLAGEGENLAGLLAEPPEAPGLAGGIFGTALAASRSDPFHPYSPEAPLRSTQAAATELTEALQAKDGDTTGDHSSGMPYDEQTARIGQVLQRSLASAQEDSQAGERSPTLDDVVPIQGTDRASAAKTFAAVLVLATSGQLGVMQPMPYGPIALSWVG